MEIKGKIGVGIITYKREKMCQQVLDSIFPNVENIHQLVVVNDSPECEYNLEYPICYIRNKENLGVGQTKNVAIDHLLKNDCTHMFIIEDDILIKDPGVFEYFIETASRTGIWHLNYGHTGKKEIIYEQDGLIFYPDPQGGFQYFHKTLITNCGYLDPNYKNAFEHADYTYCLSKRGLMPPFWCFPCPANPEKYLQINEDFEESTITDKPMYKENYNEAAQYWIRKHGSFVSAIPRPSIAEVKRNLTNIKQKYSVEN